jgi:hypothetical protein
MNFIRPRIWSCAITVAGLALGWSLPAFAQARPEAVSSGPYRDLAPGVMKAAEPDPQAKETFDRHPVVELLAVKPDLELAKNVVFRRDVWNLKFEFKPVRMIYADLPASPGRLQRKLIWYMIYSVTNTGEVMHPAEAGDGTYEIQKIQQPIQFIPRFLLESHEFREFYPDRVIPAALGPIRTREDPRRKFISSADVVEIQPGQTVWGIATWKAREPNVSNPKEINPQIDRFSIYVGGLTNAYQWEDGPYKKGDPIGTGRRLRRKWLKLNFWRPGDEYYPHEKEIRYGIPGEVDYEWVYR